MVKKITRKEQALQTEQKIFHTGIELIKIKGLNQIQVKDICSNAGVSVGSFYRYFPTKQSIIVKFMEENQKKLIEYYLSLQKVRPITKIIKIFTKMAEISESTGYEFIKETFLYHLKAEQNFFFSKESCIYSITEQIIKESLNLGLLKEAPEEVIRLILIFYRGLNYDWCLNKGAYSLKKECETQLARYLQLFFSEKNN